MIILLSGYNAVGKTTSANTISVATGYKVLSFADVLREKFLELNPKFQKYDLRASHVKDLFPEIRLGLIELGKKINEEQPTLVVSTMINKIIAAGGGVVVDDLRWIREAEGVRKFFPGRVKTIWVVRRGKVKTDLDTGDVTPDYCDDILQL